MPVLTIAVDSRWSYFGSFLLVPVCANLTENYSIIHLHVETVKPWQQKNFISAIKQKLIITKLPSNRL